MAIEPVQWLDYDRIVQPHKQVVVKGYLRRLGMEIGPKAIWLYIGFHQAAWRVQRTETESGRHCTAGDVMRFSGLSYGAFWRLLKHKDDPIRDLLDWCSALTIHMTVKFRRGRDGRPHRAPIRYQVCMTPRLTRADATTIYSRLKGFIGSRHIHPECLAGIAGHWRMSWSYSFPASLQIQIFPLIP